MATKYAICETEFMSGVKQPTDLVHVKYYVDTTETDIQNGSVVKLDSLISREVYKGVAPAANTALKDCVLIKAPELFFDDERNLDEFYNPAGEIVRGYRFVTGNIFSATAEAFDAAAAIEEGNIVELQAKNKFKVVATLTSGSTQVGVIHDIRTVGTKTFYAVKIA